MSGMSDTGFNDVDEGITKKNQTTNFQNYIEKGHVQ